MVSRLLKTGDRFKFKMSKVNGSSFFGQILDIPDTSRVSNFLSARRYLRTSPFSNIVPSDVIISGGLKYIVGEHGTGFHLGPIYKHFKLFEVDVEAKWYKKYENEDPLTGLKNFERIEQTETVYLSTQPKALIEDSLHIQQPTYIALSNIELSRDDIVDSKVVTKVDKVLGIWLLELKEQ